MDALTDDQLNLEWILNANLSDLSWTPNNQLELCSESWVPIEESPTLTLIPELADYEASYVPQKKQKLCHASTQTDLYEPEPLTPPLPISSSSSSSIVEPPRPPGEPPAPPCNTEAIVEPRKTVLWYCPTCRPPTCQQKMFSNQGAAHKHVITFKHDASLNAQISRCFDGSWGFCNYYKMCPGKISKNVWTRHMRQCDMFRQANDSYFSSIHSKKRQLDSI